MAGCSGPGKAELSQAGSQAKAEGCPGGGGRRHAKGYGSHLRGQLAPSAPPAERSLPGLKATTAPSRKRRPQAHLQKQAVQSQGRATHRPQGSAGARGSGGGGGFAANADFQVAAATHLPETAMSKPAQRCLYTHPSTSCTTSN